MANDFTLAQQYVATLDKVYTAGSLTSDLQLPAGVITATDSPGTFQIPKISVVGLGTYSRANGHPAGDLGVEWETLTYSQDRGRKFTVDHRDNIETLGVAFGMAASEFMRTKVIPEVDAYRFATIATGAGQDNYGVLDSSDEWVEAIDTAIAALGDVGVSQENAVLYITFAGKNYLKNSDVASRLTPAGVNPDARFDTWDGIKVITVPQNRFYGEISLNAGATSAVGGYSNAGGKINFVLMDKGAAFVDAKHDIARVFAPSSELARQYGADGVNQDANAWQFDYRLYHHAQVLDNAAEGIYVHGDTDIVS